MRKLKIVGKTDRILISLSELNSPETIWVNGFYEIREQLYNLWDQDLRSDVLFQVQGSFHTTWSFGLTPTFRKSLKDLDRKLQGRVFEAVMKICDSPMTIQGDTIKPLHGPLDGLWRYRIGDHRLVYKPNVGEKRIFLLEFGPRGSVYE